MMGTDTQLLDFFATHPNAKIKSNMILNIYSDASYLGALNAKMHAALHFFQGLLPQDKQPIKFIGSIQILTSILQFATE